MEKMRNKKRRFVLVKCPKSKNNNQHLYKILEMLLNACIWGCVGVRLACYGVLWGCVGVMFGCCGG
jgi:hypothetical protein